MQSRFKKKIILLLILIIGCFYSKVSLAHSPDLASLMIYEQEGKTYLVIKSSLTAFEGEVDYHFKKGAYKTPEEFTELVIQHFRNNCFVIANNYSIRFEKPQVQLGHESTLFVELLNFPKNLSSIHISNTVFKDMPNNQCELIIMLKNIKQKQIILSNENKHEVNLEVQNGELIVSRKANSIIVIVFSSISLVVLVLGIFYFLFKRKTKSISN